MNFFIAFLDELGGPSWTKSGTTMVVVVVPCVTPLHFLALAVLVVPGHPRARAEAAMSTSTEVLPSSPLRCWRRHSGNSEDDQGHGEASP